MAKVLNQTLIKSLTSSTCECSSLPSPSRLSPGSPGERSPGHPHNSLIPADFLPPFPSSSFFFPSFPFPFASFLPHFPFLPSFLGPARFSSPALNNAELQRSPAALFCPKFPLYPRLSTNFGSGRRSQGGGGMAVGSQHGNCFGWVSRAS